MQEGQHVLIFARNDDHEWQRQARMIAAERCPNIRVRFLNPKYVYAHSTPVKRAGVIICQARETHVIQLYEKRQPETRRIIVPRDDATDVVDVESRHAEQPASETTTGSDIAREPVATGDVVDHRVRSGAGSGPSP